MGPTRLALLFGFVVLACTEVRPPIEDALVGDTLPAGRLGHPIGTYLQIEGVRAEQGKVDDHTLLVDRLGGSPLSPPTAISIDNLDSLPKGARCVLRGYETGRWIGVPPGVEASGEVEPQQAMWQFYRTFIATSVQEPPALVEQFRTRKSGR